MVLSNIFRAKDTKITPSNNLKSFLNDFSIEVMPRTAEKIDNFSNILPKGTRVYIAHIEGVAIEDMVSTAKRLKKEGFNIIPHFPARIIDDLISLENWIKQYREEADVDQALLLAGGLSKPLGSFSNSMELAETELFDKYNFKKLYFAGHPEGNKDIDPDETTKNIDEALNWKQALSNRTAADITLTTQFCFDADPVIKWANDLKNNGINLPIHIGVAGPAKLQTLIKFSIACGVGPSLKVLQKRAKDLRKLLLPFEPNHFLSVLADYKNKNPEFGIDSVHFFPLGGIKTTARWIEENKNK